MKDGKRGPASSPATARFGTYWPLIAGILWFFVVAYGPTLATPFLGDDYVFLDKTRHAAFASVWSRHNIDFGWYRPWSRELYFWTLQSLFGPHELPFRIANTLLWLIYLLMQYALARRMLGDRSAGLYICGLSCLALWGAPLIWISGAQDLWMLVFVSATLLCLDRARVGLAVLAYTGALLSKETAAVVPVIVVAQAWFIHGLRGRRLWLRAAPFALLTAAWLAMHPTLVPRLLHPRDVLGLSDIPRPPLEILVRTVLSTINADQLAQPLDWETFRPWATVLSALGLAASLALAWRSTSESPAAGGAKAPRRAVVTFGAIWAGVGWAPLFIPAIGWHAYYGCLGATGAWLALSSLLPGGHRAAAAIVLALALLRGRAASSRAWEWGGEWYQSRAGSLLASIRQQLLTIRPHVPRHTRFYFGNVPNNVGLIAGASPAVRVWYDDPSLTAGFYSYYRPRAANAAQGQDLFFHFDSLTGLREVDADTLARPPRSGSGNLVAMGDEERLAMTFLRARDYPRAARLFERIAESSERADALMLASSCWRAAGESSLAARNISLAQQRTKLSDEAMRTWSEHLWATMPR